MSQITMRGLPAEVESEIRRLAYEKRISLSNASILLIQRALGVDADNERKRDLSSIFGSWNQAEYNEFCKNVRQFDEIDNEIWE